LAWNHCRRLIFLSPPSHRSKPAPHSGRHRRLGGAARRPSPICYHPCRWVQSLSQGLRAKLRAPLGCRRRARLLSDSGTTLERRHLTSHFTGSSPGGGLSDGGQLPPRGFKGRSVSTSQVQFLTCQPSHSARSAVRGAASGYDAALAVVVRVRAPVPSRRPPSVL
jgi:hypothetical protein